MGFYGTYLMKNGVKAVEGVLVGFAHDVALLGVISCALFPSPSFTEVLVCE